MEQGHYGQRRVGFGRLSPEMTQTLCATVVLSRARHVMKPGISGQGNMIIVSRGAMAIFEHRHHLPQGHWRIWGAEMTQSDVVF